MTSYEARNHYRDEKVADKYDSQFSSPLRMSNSRARIVGWSEMMAFRRLLRKVENKGVVLDIACGTGRYAELLLRHGFFVRGLDISPEMLMVAGSRLGNHPDLLSLQAGDAENLPFADMGFDGITCMRLYHRVPPEVRVRMLREVRRVGKRWAILFFGMSTPALDLRGNIRGRLLQGRPSNPFPATYPELLGELKAAGLCLEARTWIMPVLASGMLVLAAW